MKSKTRPSWLPSEVGVDPGPPRNLAPEGAKTLAVMLGSGGVTPNPHRNGPSAAVIVNDTTYVIDAGEGIWRGLAWAAVQHPELVGDHLAPTRITRLFLTHLHSDHTVGLPAVWLLPWAYGREVPFEIYGPVGTKNLVNHMVAAYEADLQERRFGPEAKARKADGWKVVAHEIEETGHTPVYEDKNVKIEAFHHQHGHFKQNFAYRFTTEDRVISWAGDGRVMGQLDEATRDADLFFCELSTEDLVGNANWGGSTPEQKAETIWSYHIRPKELADFATEMNVKQLVTMHERNYSDPYEPDALMDEFKLNYKGAVYSARDGDVY
jgi:ribonuclease BN (tRNA processing enzyme)